MRINGGSSMPSLLDWLAGLFRDAAPAPPPRAARSSHAPSGLPEVFPAGTYEDARFGTLTRNRHTGWFEVPATWAREPVQLVLETTRHEKLPAALRVAAALWDGEAEWNRRIHACAVEQHLDGRNELMRGFGQTALDADAFVRLLRLTTVSTDPDGVFEFTYDAGQALHGHGNLRVGGTLHEGPDFTEMY
jgi:hypothetical protein